MSETYKGYSIEIEPDPDPMQPREDWTPFGTMITTHGRYTLPNEDEFDFDSCSSWAEVEKVLRKRFALVLPVFMFDHSGLSLTTDESRFARWDSQRWDWGQVGFICASNAQIKECFMVPRNRKATPEQIDQARQNLIGEIETYDQYLSGDVWGYRIIDPAGEEVEACWGMYGHDYCEGEARSVVDTLPEQLAQEEAQ